MLLCDDVSFRCSGPLREYLRATSPGFDRSAVHAEFQTYVQTVQTWIWTKICYVCAVSSVLCNGTSLKNIYHAAKKRGRGVDSARGGGGMAGDLRPVLGF